MFEAIWIEAFIKVGLKPVDGMRLLMLTHNMLRGLAIASLWESEPFDRKALLQEWRRIACLATCRSGLPG